MAENKASDASILAMLTQFGGWKAVTVFMMGCPAFVPAFWTETSFGVRSRGAGAAGTGVDARREPCG